MVSRALFEVMRENDRHCGAKQSIFGGKPRCSLKQSPLSINKNIYYAHTVAYIRHVLVSALSGELFLVCLRATISQVLLPECCHCHGPRPTRFLDLNRILHSAALIDVISRFKLKAATCNKLYASFLATGTAITRVG